MVPDGPHITVTYKIIDHDSRGLHQAIHGYVLSDGSLGVRLGIYRIGSNFLRRAQSTEDPN